MPKAMAILWGAAWFASLPLLLVSDAWLPVGVSVKTMGLQTDTHFQLQDVWLGLVV